MTQVSASAKAKLFVTEAMGKLKEAARELHVPVPDVAAQHKKGSPLANGYALVAVRAVVRVTRHASTARLNECLTACCVCVCARAAVV